jgi:hypothetical protein
LVVGTARTGAGRDPVPTGAGEPAATALGAEHAATVAALLAAVPHVRGWATRRTPEWLAWRYGNPSLGYRVVTEGAAAADGLAVFRHRRRGRAVESVLCEVLVPGGDRALARRLVRGVAKLPGADYVLRIDARRVTRDGFVRLPGEGPVLACRPLDRRPVPQLGSWALTMGDVELF